MNRILILVIMISFFGFGQSNAQKKEPENIESTEDKKGVIGRYYENELPVIMKFVNELPEKDIMVKLPFLTIVSWNYDGNKNNGMPPDKINKRMIILEDALENSLKSYDLFTHVYSRTGNNLKEFAYYTTNQEYFLKMLNKTLEKHAEYPIEITFYEDKEWTDFKKVIASFEK